MYLHSKLSEFNGNINIAFIGCGKFISMFLSQYNQLKKINIDSIIDNIVPFKRNVYATVLEEFKDIL